jgi:hydroxymethylglutaryl-CoA synthase
MRADFNNDVGIIGYGHYVPPLRLEISEFARQWRLTPRMERVYRLSGRNRVSVNASDEDTITLAVAAGQRALLSAPQARPIEAILVGSESHPYAVKSSAIVVGEALGLTPDLFAIDLQFACRGGSAGMLLGAALAKSGGSRRALAIGSDCPQSSPGSLLEASVGSAACAFIVGGKADSIATIEAVASAGSDVTDFWRRDGAAYPSVVGKFSVDEGYVAHTEHVTKSLLELTRSSPADFRYVIFHQPYTALPAKLGKKLGFTPEQIKPALVASRIGNSYSASCLLALSHVLDCAATGDRILLVSFGSGAGSDGIVLSVTERIDDHRALRHSNGLKPALAEIGNAHTQSLTYGQYTHAQGKLRSCTM